jgi:hypothetical protein
MKLKQMFTFFKLSVNFSLRSLHYDVEKNKKKKKTKYKERYKA